MISKYILTVFLFIFTVSLAAEDKDLSIGLIGDSTVAKGGGWGHAFKNMFKDRANVLNYAVNGGTLKSLSKQLDKLLENEV